MPDESLVVLLNEGDEEAFEIIYDRYAKPMLNFFYLKLRSKEKAEDLMQNLFLKLIEKGKLFDQGQQFKTWFYTLAHNQCKNEFRTIERSNRRIENIKANRLVNNWESSSEKIDSSVFSEHLTLALDKLSSKHQTSFILRFKYNFTIKEISVVLECSEGTTKSRLFYALKNLAEDLKEFNPY